MGSLHCGDRAEYRHLWLHSLELPLDISFVLDKVAHSQATRRGSDQFFLLLLISGQGTIKLWVNWRKETVANIWWRGSRPLLCSSLRPGWITSNSVTHVLSRSLGCSVIPLWSRWTSSWRTVKRCMILSEIIVWFWRSKNKELILTYFFSFRLTTSVRLLPNLIPGSSCSVGKK